MVNAETVHVFYHRVPTEYYLGSIPTCDVAPKGDVGSSRTYDFVTNSFELLTFDVLFV